MLIKLPSLKVFASQFQMESPKFTRNFFDTFTVQCTLRNHAGFRSCPAYAQFHFALEPFPTVYKVFEKLLSLIRTLYVYIKNLKLCVVKITEAGMNEITKYIPEAEEEPSKDDQLK